MSSTAIIEKWNGSQNAVTDPKIIDIKSLTNEIEKFVSDASNFELANSIQNKFVADQTTFKIVKQLAPCDPGVESLHVENANYSISLHSSEDKSLKENLNTAVKTFGTSSEKISNDDQNHDANINLFFKYPLTIIEKSEQKQKTKKSIKEIIASINRSQQLLKESAQKSATSDCAESATDSICHNMEIYEITSNNLKIDNNLFARHDNITKHKIYKPIVPYRESSPTASNLDWNPLPKPKRINSGSNL